MRIVIFKIILLMVLRASYAQINQPVMVISDGTIAPTTSSDQDYSKVILDLQSSERGLLIPRMTEDEMRSMYNLNVNPPMIPKEGTLVFVIDPMKKAREGIWYWDSFLKDWVQLDVIGNYQNAAPVGSIIYYAGKSEAEMFRLFDETGLGRPDTEMRGWAICNGNVKNGTPNLSGRFLVGAKNVDLNAPFIGNPINKENKYVLDLNYFTGHNHPKHDDSHILTAHSHNLVVLPHRHVYKEGTDESAGENRRRYKLSGDDNLHRARPGKGKNTSRTNDVETGDKNVNFNKTTGPFISQGSTYVEQPSANINITFKGSVLETGVFLSEDDSTIESNRYTADDYGKALDIRPPHFKVYYLMKVGGSVY